MKTLISILVIAFTIGACSSEEYGFEGKWSFSDELDDGFSFYKEWHFESHRFSMEGYPPIYQEGHYRVKESRGDTFEVELFDQKGDLGTDPRTIEIILGNDSTQLTIENEVYTRL